MVPFRRHCREFSVPQRGWLKKRSRRKFLDGGGDSPVPPPIVPLRATWNFPGYVVNVPQGGDRESNNCIASFNRPATWEEIKDLRFVASYLQNGYGNPRVARVWEKPIEAGEGYNLVIDNIDHTLLCTVVLGDDGLGLYAIGASEVRPVAVFTVSDMTNLYEMVASHDPVIIGNLPLSYTSSGGSPLALKGIIGATNDVRESPIGIFVDGTKMFVVDITDNRSQTSVVTTRPVAQGSGQRLGVSQVTYLIASYVQIFSASYQGECRQFEDIPDATQIVFDIETGRFS